MEQSIKSTQNENNALRDYVAHLQSRLLEVHGDYPQPPPGLSLSHTVVSSIADQAPMDTGDVAPDHGADNTAPDSGSTLEAEAVAVAGLAAQEQMAAEVERYPSPTYRPESGGEDTRSADEINRHLGAGEGGGASQPQAV